VPVIAAAPVASRVRERWLARLFEAHEADGVPYIESLTDHWGELCVTKELASTWADRLLDITRLALSPDKSVRGHFHGTTACLDALLRAERFAELYDVLRLEEFWPHKRWTVFARGFCCRQAVSRKLTVAMGFMRTGQGLILRPFATSQRPAPTSRVPKFCRI
jgi:hypothetical protein